MVKPGATAEPRDPPPHVTATRFALPLTSGPARKSPCRVGERLEEVSRPASAVKKFF